MRRLPAACQHHAAAAQCRRLLAVLLGVVANVGLRQRKVSTPIPPADQPLAHGCGAVECRQDGWPSAVSAAVGADRYWPTVPVAGGTEADCSGDRHQSGAMKCRFLLARLTRLIVTGGMDADCLQAAPHAAMRLGIAACGRCSVCSVLFGAALAGCCSCLRVFSSRLHHWSQDREGTRGGASATCQERRLPQQ